MSEEPWIEFKDIWPTKSAFFTWLRSGLRKSIWQFYPPKLQFKNSQTYKPSQEYTGRAKKLVRCYLTGEEIAVSYAEIDHVEGNVSLKDWDDLLPFIRHLCASKENMAVVSKEAHKIKSYAERMGITFEEAVLEKKLIEIFKTKKDKQFLSEHDIVPESNAAKRKEQVREVLKND
jgi:hypothetical protein